MDHTDGRAETHEHHRRTLEQVREYLDELFENTIEEEGHFYVRYGSTVLEIAVEPYGPEDAAVVIMSYCVQGVDVDEELLEALLEVNHTLTFGAFSVVGSDVFLHHTLFSRTLARPNLLNALASVAETSDLYDDKISAKWGGQRALDRIKGTGGRRRRRQSAGD
ncbi:MAG: YbjN domain-containing protein [Acidobacteriota bacterium]